MVTEYYVLNALAGGGWQTADEIFPSDEWDDQWEIRRMLEILENEKLIAYVQSQENGYSYRITQSGKYRLYQLRERQEYEAKTTALLDELNKKLDQERVDRLLDGENSAKAAKRQQKTDKLRFIFSSVIGILALIVGIIAATAAVLALK